MKNISKQILLSVILGGILFAGCKKSFLDINDNPNSPTDVNITAELIFPAAAEGVGAFSVGSRASGAGAKTSMQWAQDWVGYMASNGEFARDNTETSYDIDFNFSNTLFLTRYNVLYDLHQVEVKGIASGDYPIAAASIILSVKSFQELVDLFGDIPYTQAFQPNTYPRPAYDKAQDIYANLQTRLDTAIAYLQRPEPPTAFAKADIVNHGDAAKWIKLANTIKLRLLLRQSEIGVSPAAEIAKIEATGGILEKGESVSVNPGYSNDEDKQSPFYANYGYTVASTPETPIKATTSTGANKYIVDILSVSADPRLGRFFAPVNGSFVGNPYGLPAGDLKPGASTSYFGPGLDASPSQDQWIMPSFESLFFKAEAVARGWIQGDVKSVYEDAVTQSFIWLGAKYPPIRNAANTADSIVFTPEQSAGIYLSDPENAIGNWDSAGTSVSEHVKFIAYQKYIANTCIDPQESYSDIRRLNFLTDDSYISQHEGRVGPGTLPVRLLYPQSEYTTNGDNVKKVGTIDRFTSKIFWQP